MRIKKYSKIVLLFSVLLIIVSIFIYKNTSDNIQANNITRQRVAELTQNLSQDTSFADMIQPSSIEEMSKVSHLVVMGEVVDIKNNVSEESKLQSGSPEEAINRKMQEKGFNTLKFDFTVFGIKVDQVLQGNIESKNIKVKCNSIYDSMLPKLKNGDRLIFFLRKTSDGSYSIIHPQGGLFLVGNDNISYPLLKSDNFKKYDGIDVKSIKSKLK